MNLHVHSAHRQQKSLGCEHKKRVEKRWRITRADIRPGVYGLLVLEICLPAEFSSNSDETHLSVIIKCSSISLFNCV